MQVLEKTIERKVCRDAKKKYGIENIKLNGPGQTGWPDRMFLLPMGRVVFVEFKAPKGRVRRKQQYCIDLLAAYQHKVEVCRSYDEAMRFILWTYNDARL